MEILLKNVENWWKLPGYFLVKPKLILIENPLCLPIIFPQGLVSSLDLSVIARCSH